jgi:pimeloyl-ACP methyl ester carboxylesterase
MKVKQKIAVSYLKTKFKILSLLSEKKAAEQALDLFRTPQRRARKQPSAIFTEAEKLEFSLDDIPIHGYRWNQNPGKKILIIHGFESSIVNFEQYVHPLMNKGYEVLAFDAPAHGRSGGSMISAPQFAKMIGTIWQRYGPIQSFIAHSFGGLALSLALENIYHDINYRVVLIAPATETKTAIDQFFEFLKLNGKVRTEFDRLIAQIGGYPAEWYSVHRAVKNIHAKILWLHDEDDLQTPITDALKVKAENLPNVKFLITKGLGHRRIYRDSKVMQEVIDFL